jgi:Zn-dependent M28 family amino/carboxypeptidase
MYKRYLSHGRLSFPPAESEIEKGYFIIPASLGAEILNTSDKKLEEALNQSEAGSYKNLLKLQSQEIIFYVQQDMQKISTENVLGFIEGSDKKDEYVIITAHYDHIGINDGEVYNGADDDGSGTVAVMEIAQAFAQAKKEGHGPRRSILFMAVTGEEKGLLGSSYYVNNPVLPLEKTITNLNIDMIGRIDEAHESNPEYVYLIGSDKLSKGLHNVSERANSTYTKLELDYKYNDENDPNRYYYRSDHYNFAKNNIPVIFYFNGTHADYHKASDTIDKIEFELLEKRSRLVFHTTWEIANGEESISVDVLPNNMDIDGTN